MGNCVFLCRLHLRIAAQITVTSPSVLARESTAGTNVRQSGVLHLENRIPTELGRTPRGNDLAVCAALEQDGFFAWARAVRESA